MTDLPASTKKKLGLVIDLDTCVGCHACAVACKEWNDGGQFGPLPDVDTQGSKPDGVWFNRVHTFEVLIGQAAEELQPHDSVPDDMDRDSGLGTRDSVKEPGLGTRDSGLEKEQRQQPGSLHIAQVASPRPGESDTTRVPYAPQAQVVHFPRSCLHCETPDCVTVCPTGASYKRAEDGIVLVDEDKCIGCQLCAWACPYGAREFNHDHGVMQKCTLCVDRIYNESLDETDRQPACVAACPTRARHFGDLGDPASAVSQLVAERGGY
ncbi:MAG: 4Fe-4S dicluster domain-containing protein, partial [Rhodanobacteraceae bacterium]